jgi:hypothetical protein
VKAPAIRALLLVPIAERLREVTHGSPSMRLPDAATAARAAVAALASELDPALAFANRLANSGGTAEQGVPRTDVITFQEEPARRVQPSCRGSGHVTPIRRTRVFVGTPREAANLLLT